MKRIIYFLIVILAIPFSLLAKPENKNVKVMSFNIRYYNNYDKEYQWKFRRDFAADLIRFHAPDIIGAQEVLNNQLNDLLERLPEYSYVGVGRLDGKTKGEYSAIFYRKDRFIVENSGHFWLSEDMNAIGKKGWDAACERIATWAIFKDKSSGKKFFFLNTHTDHVGKVARHESGLLLLEQSKVLSKGLPSILTGDLNAAPEDPAISMLMDPKDPRHFTNSRSLASFKYGPEGTFHNYGKIPFEKRNMIDYILLKGGFKVLDHAVLTDTNGYLYPSDHYPIMSTLQIQ